MSGMKFAPDSWKVHTKNENTLIFGFHRLNPLLTEGQDGWLFSYAYEKSDLAATLNIKSVGIIFGNPPTVQDCKRWFKWKFKKTLEDFL